MSTHTPGPWGVDELGTKIWSLDKHCIADCGPKRDYAHGMQVCLANAAHIVACVNSHDALLAACRAWLDKTTSADDAMHMTKLAIKLAEGQG